MSHVHPVQTHHHLLFAYFCSVHLSFLDTDGAATCPPPGIIKKHLSHQDCQFVHIQPGLQHKVTRVMCEHHKHIHVLITLKQEREASGGFPSGQILSKVYTYEVTHTWGSSRRGGIGRVNVSGVVVTFTYDDAPAPKRDSFGTLTAGFKAGQWRTSMETNLMTVTVSLFVQD